MGDEGFGTVGAGEVEERFARYLAEESNRGFGDIPLRAEAAVSPFSRAKMDAAANLLEKAQRALREGNDERARRMVERAVALPYDEVERAHPAAWQAHMSMFMAVTDAAEEDDGEDWLDAVLERSALRPGKLGSRSATAWLTCFRTISCPATTVAASVGPWRRSRPEPSCSSWTSGRKS